MIRVISQFARLSLFLTLACGSEPPDTGMVKSCETCNAICESMALRTRDPVVTYVRLRDCSWDYGTCIRGGVEDCEERCALVAFVPSECVYGCSQ